MNATTPMRPAHGGWPRPLLWGPLLLGLALAWLIHRAQGEVQARREAAHARLLYARVQAGQEHVTPWSDIKPLLEETVHVSGSAD